MKITNKFKRTLSSLMAMGALLSLPVFQSCSDKNEVDQNLLSPSGIATVKSVENKFFYLQIDDNTKLWPIENSKVPYEGKEMRAFVNFTETDGFPEGTAVPDGYDKDIYAKTVKINWMDTILTKKPVPTKGTEEDIAEYGKDPVEIYKNWMTNVEDGYLTIHFGTYWGSQNVRHAVNLITGTNPEDPYEVVFRHNAFDDNAYVQGDGIVAFSLADLPDTKGETVQLTLKFKSFSGDKTARFDYCTRKN